MAKADVKSTFRLLPVKPKDFDLLGLQMDGFFLVENCMPMGASSAPALFETSTFLEWAVKEKAQCDRVVHYADDFMVYGLSGKGLESCHCQVFLGLEIDAARQLVCIPMDKLVKLRLLINQACVAKKLTLKELQSVIGSLSFVCKAVPPGRAFLRRIINLTLKLKCPSHVEGVPCKV